MVAMRRVRLDQTSAPCFDQRSQQRAGVASHSSAVLPGPAVESNVHRLAGPTVYGTGGLYTGSVLKDYYEHLWEELPEDLHPPELELRTRLLQSEIRSGDRVLDLGCGSGTFTAVAAAAGAATVIGAEVADGGAGCARAPPIPSSTSASSRSTGRCRSRTRAPTSSGAAR